MDHIKAGLQELVDGDIDVLSGAEQREQVEAALRFDEFVPTEHPALSDATYYNPGVEGYQETHTWTSEGWTPIEDTSPLQRYPEYLPTDTAIDCLIDQSPILEIGAGQGYWTHVVNENGGDCTATDKHPLDIDGADYPRTKTYSIPDDTVDKELYTETQWAPLTEADHTCISEHPDHTVLLCHPSAQPWTEAVLDHLGAGQPFIFVGEWYPGSDAIPQFFKRLIDDFTLHDRFPVYNWQSTHAAGYVFHHD